MLLACDGSSGPTVQPCHRCVTVTEQPIAARWAIDVGSIVKTMDRSAYRR